MTKTQREQAILYCAMVASGESEYDEFDAQKEFDDIVAGIATAAMYASPDGLVPLNYFGDPDWWRYWWADAEAMLREGWSP